MRVSGVLSLAALVVGGIIVADLIAHPTGTKAAAGGLVNLATPTYSALLGNVPSGYKAA